MKHYSDFCEYVKARPVTDDPCGDFVSDANRDADFHDRYTRADFQLKADAFKGEAGCLVLFAPHGREYFEVGNVDSGLRQLARIGKLF